MILLLLRPDTPWSIERLSLQVRDAIERRGRKSESSAPVA